MDQQIHIQLNCLPKVTTVGRFEVKEPWIHGDRSLYINTMIYVVEGTVYVNEEDTSYEIPSNHIFFFKGGCHQYGTKPIQKDAKWYWVSFEDSNNIRVSNGNQMEVVSLPKIIDCSDNERIYKIIIRMADVYISDVPYKSPILEGALYQIFYEIMNLTVRQHSEMVTHNIAPKVIRILQQQLEKSFSSEVVARELGMNYCYLGRLFKKETGMSINHYYMKLKVNQAINLLHTSDMNITQISDLLNYPNPYYFSRVFKKITGMSPTQYLKQIY